MKVTSDEQNAFVASRYSSSRCLTEGTWIGLRRNPKNLSQWVWRDDFNVKPQYTKWHRKEPMNERLDKNCTEIHPSKSIYWYGRECSARGCYICVKGKLWVIMVFLGFWTFNSFLVPWSPWRSTWFFFQMPTSVTIIISVAANVVPMSLEVINVLAGQAIQRPKKNENVKVLITCPPPTTKILWSLKSPWQRISFPEILLSIYVIHPTHYIHSKFAWVKFTSRQDTFIRY